LLCAAVGQAVDLERLQREAAGERRATGPWKQVIAIESCNRMSSGAGMNGTPPARTGNHNVFAFLDCKRFALADGQHPIRVFSVKDGKLLRSFGRPETDAWYARYMVSSLDGRLLVLLPDVQPEIWDTQTGEAIGRLPVVDDKYSAAAFLPGGRTLATYYWPGGAVFGHLQIWHLNERERKVTLRKSTDADDDARGLAIVGPYLLLKNYRRSQVFDAGSMECLLRQPRDVDEELLFLDPPLKNEPGRFVSLEYHPLGTNDWMKSPPQFREISLPDGREARRWGCPVEENKENDHRWQTSAAVGCAVEENRGATSVGRAALAAVVKQVRKLRQRCRSSTPARTLCRISWLLPVLDQQCQDPTELLRIVRHHGAAVRQGDGRNLKVVRSDRRAQTLQVVQQVRHPISTGLGSSPCGGRTKVSSSMEPARSK
jgi:hypothetical protein